MATTQKTKKGGPVALKAARPASPLPPARGADQGSDGPENKIRLNPDNPIPYEFGAAWATWGGHQYIPFFNPDDRFAQTLLEARLLSSTQFACVNTKRLYTVGQGIRIRNLIQGETVDPLWISMAERANAKRQSIHRVMDRTIESFLTFGNTPIELVRGRVGGKPFLYIYAKNLQDCRLGRPNDSGEVENVLVSKAFRESGVLLDTDKIKTIPLYKTGRANPQDNWIKDGPVERSMIWLKNEVAGYDHYGLPSSIASLIYQVLEYADARFNLDNVENNMIVGGAIFLTGGVTQPEADRIGSTMIRRHTGHGKRGRTMVFASENGITDAKYLSLDTHKEGSYGDQDERCESKILFANEWDATLAGLKHKNALGKGGGYLKEIYEQKLKTVIIPLQTLIIEAIFPILKEVAKEHLSTDWDHYDFGFDPIQLDNKTSQASTTVEGLHAFLDIIGLVASGAYPLPAAIKLIMARFGLSEQEAKDQLGEIKVIGKNVRTKSNGPARPDNSAGDSEKDGDE